MLCRRIFAMKPKFKLARGQPQMGNLILFKMAFLRYNWPTINRMYLECTICSVWHVHICETITIMKIMNTFLTTKCFFVLLGTPHLPPPCATLFPRWGYASVARDCFVFSRGLCEECNMNSFSSGFFYSALFLWDSYGLYISLIYSILLLNHIPLYGYASALYPIHLLMDIWVVNSFGLLQMKLLWTFVYRSLYGCIFFFSLGWISRSAMAGS